MSIAKLKPCPFCGSQAKMHQTKAHDYFVKCTENTCGARTKQCHENEPGAALAWNRREGEDKKHNGKFVTVAKLTMMQKGMTGVKLQELTGIARSTLSIILSGRYKPYPSQKERIAKALDWTGDPDELFEEVQS